MPDVVAPLNFHMDASDELTSFCRGCHKPTFTFGSGKKVFCFRCEEWIRVGVRFFTVLVKIGLWITVIVLLVRILQK